MVNIIMLLYKFNTNEDYNCVTKLVPVPAYILATLNRFQNNNIHPLTVFPY